MPYMSSNQKAERANSSGSVQNIPTFLHDFPGPLIQVLVQGVKYSIEASSSINTGVETTRSHLAD